ncbi:flagellin, partial [Pseudoalteromonas holothuriae]
TATLTKAQILQQASSTILSQANQRPQSALSLLG